MTHTHLLAPVGLLIVRHYETSEEDAYWCQYVQYVCVCGLKGKIIRWLCSSRLLSSVPRTPNFVTCKIKHLTVTLEYGKISCERETGRKRNSQDQHACLTGSLKDHKQLLRDTVYLNLSFQNLFYSFSFGLLCVWTFKFISFLCFIVLDMHFIKLRKVLYM